MRFHVLHGLAQDRYLQWQIDLDNFWQLFPAINQDLRHEPQHVRSVYVDAQTGGPFGETLITLVQHYEVDKRLRALYIHVYGHENEVPCRECEASLKATDRGNQRGMSPFFGCRSLSIRGVPACSNCFFRGKSATCTFTQEKYSHFRANHQRHPPLESDIHRHNSPILHTFGPAQLDQLASLATRVTW